ncbi:MAG TPA: hypothetical protein VFP97_02620, partial [Chitinophagaceae bacterium]|nr:hypothetical protein [Chitinophagaceae bacterium]
EKPIPMQFKQSCPRPLKGCLCLLLLVPGFTISISAQTTYLNPGDKAYVLIERMEILGQNDSVLNFSKTRPFSRKEIIPAVERYVSIGDSFVSTRVQGINLSRVDMHNVASLYAANPEWSQRQFTSKKAIGRFYRNPANLYEVHVKDFDLVINPIIQFQYLKESDNDESLFLNSRGVGIRGRIANKIGFAASIIDNQERDPEYVQAWENKYQSVPGAGYYKNFKGTGFDYFDARGYFTFNVTKYIDVAFGYDRNFIGNGYRSLFLSDFSNNTLFLKLNTRIWKINYQNLFMELHQTEPRGPDRLLRKKYAVFHHLDVNVTKKLNIGLFEGVMFGRSNRFEFGYLNPVIFYRSIEQQNGSFDNSVAGVDFKLNTLKQVQLYGQFLLDEFNLKEIKNNNGWWANKWGLQLGAKYINAFGIKNLDLQLEHNRVRPFTYSHRDSVANYTHYNQPLAHPLGANFNEMIGILRYQPAPKWIILAKAMSWKQGLDTGSRSFGGNVFLPNVPPYRQGDYGYEIVSGIESKTRFSSLLLSYELKENMFVEGSLTHRKFDVPSNSAMSTSTTVVAIGFRWNMHRRIFEF